MGDQGRLYVNENVVPAYKSILRDADLILPNQFEAEYVLIPGTAGSQFMSVDPSLKPEPSPA